MEWDEEQEELARKQVKQNSEVKLTTLQVDNFDLEANKQWDAFYGVHSNRFFKDRHWLFTEFPELNFNGKFYIKYHLLFLICLCHSTLLWKKCITEQSRRPPFLIPSVTLMSNINPNS